MSRFATWAAGRGDGGVRVRRLINIFFTFLCYLDGCNEL